MRPFLPSNRPSSSTAPKRPPPRLFTKSQSSKSSLEITMELATLYKEQTHSKLTWRSSRSWRSLPRERLPSWKKSTKEVLKTWIISPRSSISVSKYAHCCMPSVHMLTSVIASSLMHWMTWILCRSLAIISIQQVNTTFTCCKAFL